MLAETRWKIGPPNLRHLAAERHARQLFLQALPLGRIGRFGESADEREKPFLLSLFGLEAGLDQVDEDAIGTNLPRFGQRADTLGDSGRDRDALTDSFLRFCHSSTLHQDAPLCTAAALAAADDWVVDLTRRRNPRRGRKLASLVRFLSAHRSL